MKDNLYELNEKYEALQILNADTNAKYQELVEKYERVEKVFNELLKEVSELPQFSDYPKIVEKWRTKAGLPTDK